MTFSGKSFYILLSEEPPAPSISGADIGKQPFPEPAEKGIPANAGWPARLSGPVIGPTVQRDSHC